jgi:hypothetical protein
MGFIKKPLKSTQFLIEENEETFLLVGQYIIII